MGTRAFAVMASPFPVMASPFCVMASPFCVMAGPFSVMASPFSVMAGLDPAIRLRGNRVPRKACGRVKPGHDGKGTAATQLRRACLPSLLVERQQGGGAAGDQGADQTVLGRTERHVVGHPAGRRISAARCG